MIRILIVSVVLSGCSTLTEIRKYYFYMTKAEREEYKKELVASQRQKCTELGFKSDTIHHTNCVLELEKARLASVAANRAADRIAIQSASQAQSSTAAQQILNHGAGGCTPDFATGGCL